MFILITGTIAPDQSLRQLTIKDTGKRLQQYLDALEKTILALPGGKIVFCENSGYGTEAFEQVKELAEKSGTSFEALSFKGNTSEVVKHGKGYGEGETVEYVLNNSKLAAGEDFFIKLTGRLVVDNIGAISRLVKRDTVYFNIPNIHRREFYDTRLYGMPVKTFREHFLNRYKDVNDDAGMILETVYTDSTVRNSLKVRNFPRYPRIVGLSGSSGISYDYTEWKCRIRDVLSAFNVYGKVNLKSY